MVLEKWGTTKDSYCNIPDKSFKAIEGRYLCCKKDWSAAILDMRYDCTAEEQLTS